MSLVARISGIGILVCATFIMYSCKPGDAQSAALVNCPADSIANCLYVSDLDYPVVTVRNLSLTDYARNGYVLDLLIRYPEGAAGPLPVVFWNHGGRPNPNAGERSENWSTKLAAAGYVVIHPVRNFVPDVLPYLTECSANGYATEEECAYWVTQYRFGPQNTHFLIAHLLDIEAQVPALAGKLDNQHIVVAGHSAGSTTVLANAGAWQQWTATGPRYDEKDDTPIAFLASGVQGPMYAGFHSGFHSPGEYAGLNEHSFKYMDRPFVFITGVGDETGEPPEARATGWLTSIPGNKLLLWDTNPEAKHETMDAQKCDTQTQQQHCEMIKATGLAFLDAVVRERDAANQWLKSNTLKSISGGEIELHWR